MLVGAMGRQSEPLNDLDKDVITFAHLDIVQTSYNPTLSDTRLIYHPEADDKCALRVADAYDKGFRYFVIHQCPNSLGGGYREWWWDGKQYGAWWAGIVSQMKKHFPEAKFILPPFWYGRQDNSLFGSAKKINEVWKLHSEAIYKAQDTADYYQLRAHWSQRGGMRQAIFRIDSYLAHFDIPVIVIFSNSSAIVSKEDKASEYLEFYRELNNRENVFAALSFCISSPLEEHKFETWRGESGALNEIPKVIRDRGF